MQTLSVFSVGILTLATITHSSKTSVPVPADNLRIAIIDYASIIDELDGITVYSNPDNAIDLSLLSKTQMITVLKTIDEVDNAVTHLCQTHRISLVLRRTRKETDECRQGFLSDDEIKNKLFRQLNRPIIYESKMDITAMVLATLKKNRE